MKIDTEKADGTILECDGYQVVKAVRKPNAHTTILQEVWWKGTNPFGKQEPTAQEIIDSI